MQAALFQMDSLDSVEIVIAIEETFDLVVPDEAAEGMTTPRHIIEWVLPRVGGEVPNDAAVAWLKRIAAREHRSDSNDGLKQPWQRERVASVVREIIAEQTGNRAFDDDSAFRGNILS